MTLRSALSVVFAAVALLATPPAARAQGPEGSDTLSRRAVAESLKVLDQLGKRVKENPKDAAAWYRRGMIAFALAERTWSTDTIPGLDYRKMRLIAFDALMAAWDLKPNNKAYSRAVTAYHASDRSILGRFSGRPLTCDANLDHYASDTNVASRATSILDMGWVCWVDFDGYEDRGMSAFQRPFIPEGNPKRSIAAHQSPSGDLPKDAAPWSVCGASADCGATTPLPVIMRNAIDSVLATLEVMPFDVGGEADYLRAKTLFAAGYALRPNDDRAYHSYAMLLAARDNWRELQKLARDRAFHTPADPWGWLALALANYRLTPGKEVRATFDSAFALLSVRERKRLDRFERLLRPTDTLRFQRLDEPSRASAAATSFFLADPLWSAQNADPRTEFLARVTYAELRWSLPAQHVYGADTDRGEVYIRYGPPKKIVGETVAESHTMYTFWVYNAELIFAFAKGLHTGKAVTDTGDIGLMQRVREWQPARWDNIATSRIDSMPTQVVRFRAGTDSVAMYLATKAPVDTMRAFTVGNVQPTAHFWLYPFGSDQAFIDSVPIGATGALQWTRRLAPGPYYYRVEATIPGTLVAGRTAAQMMMGPDSASGFRLVGFGLSDLLVATRAVSSTPIRRWTDLDIIPVLGDIAKGTEISLVWENYELGRQGTNARYDVAITVERERTKSGQIGARIAGVLAGAVGVSASKDKVAMKFERTVPHAPVLTENVALALRDTPPGSYRLTVQVADKVSGRASSRTVRIVIHE